MKKRYISLPSTDPRSVLNVITFIPNDKTCIKGLIQICHGMTEHMERYNEFAEYFTNSGYIVFGNDIISHGKSTSTRSNSLHFDDWFYAVEDINKVREYLMKKYTGMPVYLLGFSLGSFLVRSMRKEDIEKYEKEILIGTGYQPAWAMNIMYELLKIKYHTKMNFVSAKVKQIAFESYNKEFHGKPDKYWLLTDKAARDEYENDPWVKTNMTPGFFCEFLRGMGYTSKMLKRPNNVIPTLFMCGKEDPVSGFGKGMEKVFKAYYKFNHDVEMKQVAGSHDILHNTWNTEVFESIKNFIS